MIRFGRWAVVALAAAMLFAIACGDDDDDSTEDETAGDDDAPGDDDDSASEPVLTIRYHRIPSAPAPPNPATGGEAPEAYNRAAFTRYHYTVDGEPMPVGAVLIAVGGFMAGANNYHHLAQELLRLSGGSVEVWAMDRRPNLLEDLTGVEAAEREKNPDIVYDYYVDGKEVDGRTFAGFVPDREADYLSEWGAATTSADLRAMIELIPKERRRDSVFLAGHSLGGFVIENFAAWDFDGDPATVADAGFNEIAGLVLLDGTVTEFSAITGLWQLVDWFAGFGDSSYAIALDFVRRIGPRYFAVKELQSAMVQLEGWAMAADWAPDAISNVGERSDVIDLAMRLLFGRDAELTATNAAVLGVALDNDFQWISAMTSGFGDMAGPTEPHDPLLFVFNSDRGKTFLRPAGAGPFGWINAADMTEPAADDVTDLHTLARAGYEGRTNWIEWYFNTRIVLDLLFNNDMDIQANGDDPRWGNGLRAIHTASCDVPVIGFGAGLGFIDSPYLFEKYRGMLAPVRGSGGAPREEAGYEAHVIPNYSHHDILLAGYEGRENVVFPTLLEWMERWGGGEPFVVPPIESAE